MHFNNFSKKKKKTKKNQQKKKPTNQTNKHPPPKKKTPKKRSYNDILFRACGGQRCTLINFILQMTYRTKSTLRSQQPTLDRTTPVKQTMLLTGT